MLEFMSWLAFVDGSKIPLLEITTVLPKVNASVIRGNFKNMICQKIIWMSNGVFLSISTYKYEIVENKTFLDNLATPITVPNSVAKIIATKLTLMVFITPVKYADHLLSLLV